MKKTGLGTDPLSWIQPTTGTTVRPKPPRRPAALPRKRAGEKVPKFQTFEVRLTALLRDDQLEFLEKLVRDIRKNRTSEFKKERITKNTLIRVFLDAFREANLDLSNVSDEETLLARVLDRVKK